MQSCLGVLAINWVFQGVRGMQNKELSFRIFLFMFAAVILNILIDNVFIAIFVAHTINWLFNGHIWVCVRYCSFYKRNPDALQEFLNSLINDIRKRSFIKEAVCIGSVGDKNQINSHKSDIDLRIFFASGFDNYLKINLYLLKLRSLAFLKVIPLDLYAYDSILRLRKFRQDEGLLIIKDEYGDIAKLFSDRIQKNA